MRSCSIWISTARRLVLTQWNLILKIQNIHYHHFNTENSEKRNCKSVWWTKTKRHVNKQIILHYQHKTRANENHLDQDDRLWNSTAFSRRVVIVIQSLHNCTWNVSNKTRASHMKWENQCFANLQQSRFLRLTIALLSTLTIEHSSTLKKKEKKVDLKEEELFYSWNSSQEAMNEKTTIDERIKLVDEAKFTNFSSENEIHER